MININHPHYFAAPTLPGRLPAHMSQPHSCYCHFHVRYEEIRVDTFLYEAKYVTTYVAGAGDGDCSDRLLVAHAQDLAVFNLSFVI